ncbi:SUMO-activating enzyme subunit 1 [Bacillus rossius redtenbacheri]|uniref:SUMO-activating enzyme subunit 1 n=1 Tax=Bacillus rossius redtenbacheri TaxID=93214 RepID=UPI002FDD29C5
MDAHLTEEEEQLYDRQLRVWGLESQKRLRAARVLVIGMHGLGSEIAKNLILSGVRSLTMMDHTVVTEEDFSANLFVERSHLGKNRAESSLAHARQLNPSVEVTADTSCVKDKTDAFFKNFELVCATGCDKAQIVSLDYTCRSLGIKFYYGAVWGLFGCMAADCGLHEYTTMSSVPMQPKAGDESQKDGMLDMTFQPLDDVLNADWKSEDLKGKAGALQPEFLLLLVLLEFQKRTGRKPSPASRDKDLTVLKDIRDSWLPDIGIKEPEKVGDTYFSCLYGEVSPVCGIMGGIIAQEITKVLSQVEMPYNNLFFYNPLTCKGYVDTIP